MKQPFICVAGAILCALALSGCVDSSGPLLSDAQPVLGQQLRLQFYSLRKGIADEPEQAVLTALVRYPETVRQAAANRTPHTLVHYLRDLANTFHTWYNAATFIVEDPPLRNARLALALGVQQVVRNGLGLLGVSAPESM